MFTDDTAIDTAEKAECHEYLQKKLNADFRQIKDNLNYR